MHWKKTICDFFSTKIGFEFPGWDIIAQTTVSQQIGIIDCGVYTCQFAKWIAFDLLDSVKVTPEDAVGFRAMMVLEIVDGKLRMPINRVTK
jgi:Ulp1 family protease